MGESGTSDLTVLVAVGILFILAVIFTALYFRARAANRRLQQQLADADNRLLQAQRQQPQSTPSLSGDTRSMALPSASARSLATATRVVPAVTANPQHDPATALFDIRGIEVEIDQEQALPYLEITSEIDKGKRFPLGFQQAYSIGRSSTNDVVINDPSASRQHAEIYFADGYFMLRDNNSSNHTLCNGHKIAETKLQLGDMIRFANTDAKFSLLGFELMQNDSAAAIDALRQTLRLCPDFIPALRTLAFLLERDVARHQEAHAIWARLKQLEKAH